jgi:hypothetical protein
MLQQKQRISLSALQNRVLGDFLNLQGRGIIDATQSLNVECSTVHRGKGLPGKDLE